MRYRFKLGIACLLAMAIFAGVLPATVFAANNEMVLTSIYHTSAIAAVNVTGTTSATLKVPYNHSSTVNLSQGLDVSYNTTIYSSVVPDFPGGSTAVVDGDPVEMVVTYQRRGDATLYRTTYTLNVVRAAFVAPTFTGTVAKSVRPSQSVAFSLDDFTSKYVKNDGGELSAISITGSNPTFGTLKLGSASYASGSLVSVSDLKYGRLTFSATGTGVVSYIAKAYAAGDTETPIGSVVVTITSASIASTFSGTISKTVSLPNNLVLTLADFTSKYTKNDGAELGSIVITGNTSSVGRLRLGSTDYVLGAPISATNLAGGKLTFATAAEGVVSYTVKAYAAGNTTTAVGSAVLKITVEEPAAADIVYATDWNTPVTFDAADFNESCVDLTDEYLSYVKFTLPSTSYGKLYYNYVSPTQYGSAVSSTGKYYRNSSPYLSEVSLVPKVGFVGTVDITYTGYNVDGESYTGIVRILVRESEDADDILYIVDEGKALTFDESDFEDACDDLTGEPLNYVKFQLPSTSYGRLYYNYTSSSDYSSVVSATTKYYADSSPYLSRVTFVPKAGYSGTVAILYTGYNDDGETYSGKVKITVRQTAGDIVYTVPKDSKVELDSSLFNEACEDLTGERLSYVKFQLPSSSQGVLYYDYNSSVDPGTKVTSTAKYYRNSSPYLSMVTFVPKAGYSGTVSISYTGYDVDGESYGGTVKITVKQSEASQYFDDVGKNYSWASSAIDYLYKAGVVSGVGGSYYSPAANITRGDFMLMLYRAFDLSANTSGNFQDVPWNSYYYNAIAVAKALGIAQGDGTMFRPTHSLTRQDAMVLVARAIYLASDIDLDAGSSRDLSGFYDRGQISDYAENAVAALVRAGVIEGTAGRLNPLGNITRAEMAVILYRILNLD